MMIVKSSDARGITNDINESIKVKEFLKGFSKEESNKMNNIFISIKKSATQGDNFIAVDPSYFSDSMLNMMNFLGYKLKKTELTW